MKRIWFENFFFAYNNLKHSPFQPSLHSRRSLKFADKSVHNDEPIFVSSYKMWLICERNKEFKRRRSVLRLPIGLFQLISVPLPIADGHFFCPYPLDFPSKNVHFPQ